MTPQKKRSSSQKRRRELFDTTGSARKKEPLLSEYEIKRITALRREIIKWTPTLKALELIKQRKKKIL